MAAASSYGSAAVNKHRKAMKAVVTKIFSLWEYHEGLTARQRKYTWASERMRDAERLSWLLLARYCKAINGWERRRENMKNNQSASLRNCTAKALQSQPAEIAASANAWESAYYYTMCRCWNEWLISDIIESTHEIIRLGHLSPKGSAY